MEQLRSKNREKIAVVCDFVLQNESVMLEHPETAHLLIDAIKLAKTMGATDAKRQANSIVRRFCERSGMLYAVGRKPGTLENLLLQWGALWDLEFRVVAQGGSRFLRFIGVAENGLAQLPVVLAQFGVGTPTIADATSLWELVEAHRAAQRAVYLELLREAGMDPPDVYTIEDALELITWRYDSMHEYRGTTVSTRLDKIHGPRVCLTVQGADPNGLLYHVIRTGDRVLAAFEDKKS